MENDKIHVQENKTYTTRFKKIYNNICRFVYCIFVDNLSITTVHV